MSNPISHFTFAIFLKHRVKSIQDPRYNCVYDAPHESAGQVGNQVEHAAVAALDKALVVFVGAAVREREDSHDNHPQPLASGPFVTGPEHGVAARKRRVFAKMRQFVPYVRKILELLVRHGRKLKNNRHAENTGYSSKERVLVKKGLKHLGGKFRKIAGRRTSFSTFVHMKAITLKAGREKSALRYHPWIFSGAVDEVIGDPTLGDTVEVYSYKSDFLGLAAYSPKSQIRGRFWTFGEKRNIDRDFFSDLLDRAIAARKSRGFDIEDKVSAFRLINAENDGIPGCIIDKYADIYSVEILAAGAEVHRNTIYELLAEKIHCKGIYERCDSEVRKKEGLPLRKGTVFGEVGDEPVIIDENGILFPIDVKNGHKTGYYLDQRDARRRIGELSRGKKVLNCFCYTGGFGLYALRGGCEKVYQVDVSKNAIKLAKEGIMRNKLSTAHATHVEADVFQYLRRCRDRAETFDLIVLDPPKFIESKDSLQKGARGYKDINLLAMKLLAEGGMLATFSCSGLMEMDLFQKIVADAAADANRRVQIIERFGQPMDHPVSTAFPEGQYLKGLLLQVV